MKAFQESCAVVYGATLVLRVEGGAVHPLAGDALGLLLDLARRDDDPEVRRAAAHAARAIAGR